MPLPGNGYLKAVVPGTVPSHLQGAAGETWPGPLEFVAGEVQEGVSQGGLRMEPRQGTCSAARTRRRHPSVVDGEREEDAETFVQNCVAKDRSAGIAAAGGS